MKLIPNIGPKTRIAYVVIGAGLVALSLLAPFLDRGQSVMVGVVGAATIVSGAVGF